MTSAVAPPSADRHARRLWWTAAVGMLAALLLGLGSQATAGEGFRQVTGPCQLRFPRDHGAHGDYRSEWWYYTGNVGTPAGRPFGFQMTIFHSRIAPAKARKNWPHPVSHWRTDQVYLGHAALSDITGGRHPHAHVMARGVLQLADVTQDDQGTTGIRIGGWEIRMGPDHHHIAMQRPEFAFQMTLKPEKPLIRQGEDGYSLKGSTPERASCYYSFSRLAARGRINLGKESWPVAGLAWMDHEFSSAPLEPGITGWDWFSLQLSDQSEIMLYLMRRSDGSRHPASSGVWIAPDGATQRLALKDLQMEVLKHWKSPSSGADYPAQWKLRVLPLDLELMVSPRLEDQEMRPDDGLGVVYWEGSVAITGRRGGTALRGNGYVELTGYAKPFDGPL